MSEGSKPTSPVRAELVEALVKHAEPASMALIGVGLAMLMQPWSLDIYSYSFAVLLAGVAGYTVAGKLPHG